MRCQKVWVHQIDGGSFDDASDKVCSPRKIILVVRALCRTVGDYKRCLPTTSCTTRALRVIGRRWRGIAQINDIKLRDVDSQLHRRRAVKQWQKIPLFPGNSTLSGHFRHAVDVTAAKAEATFAQFAQQGVDLGGVFARLECHG